MKIGYAQTVITPSLERPVFLAGFGNNRRAKSIHDDLFARALSISDEYITLVLCSVDLVGFFRPDVLDVTRLVRVKAPGIEILVASTHTHHGPDTMGLWGRDHKTRGVDPVYMAELKEKTSQTILTSLENMQPCTGMKSTAVHVPGFVKNARNPEIIDDELTALQFLSAGGKLQATLMNFPCHPEVLWMDNPVITSDYPHYLRAEVEAQTGASCIFFNGALGGMLTPDVPEDAHNFESAEKMGRGIARAGLQAFETTSGLQPAVSIQKKEIKVKLTNMLYKLAFLRKLLPDTRDKTGRLVTEVNLIKLGEAWFATVPGEMLPKLGLQIKADLTAAGARVAGVIGLANDELGYILPVEDFKYPWNPFNPGKHYEETNSIGKEIAPKIMEALRSLL